MELIVVVLVGGILFWWSVRRGRLFVRSVGYLNLLQSGFSEMEANDFVFKLFTKRSKPSIDDEATKRAKSFANREYGGKQLPIINLARNKGFIG